MAAESDETLHERLDAIQAKIGQRIEVVHNLARIKSGIQRQLNDRHDPVARLPVELSSKIFTHCVPSRNEYGTLSAAILLIRICSSWTEIALFTPSLWANLHIDIPASELTSEWTAYLAAWLARGRQYPLLLSVSGPSTISHTEIMRLIIAHAHHIRVLEVQPQTYLGVFLPYEHGAVAVFPILEFVDVYLPNHGWRTLEVDRVVHALKASPKLQGFYMGTGDMTDGVFSEAPVPFRHHGLTTLNLSESRYACLFLLPYLTLPSLLHLEIMIEEPMEDVNGVISFINRSSPPLEELNLNATNSEWPRDAAERLLDAVPGLFTFSLWNGSKVQETFMELLFLQVRDLLGSHVYLPTLEELIFTVYEPWPATEWYTKLTGLLDSRSSTLKYATVVFNEWEEGQAQPTSPKVEDKQILRNLIAKGMQIDLGPLTICLDESAPLGQTEEH
ncbi:hypothetical protein R3P38DRAFT_2729694 [Favolaschia claudopus]|uniref:F-box domain-containing protein n=1 Tax=Favolaschia claudopus TaxID=2862362 RepID=A0AAW0A8N7_9AGAR